MPHFTENKSNDHQKKCEKYKFAWDHYTGKYADNDNIAQYLNKKEQRESENGFNARKEDSDVVLYFPTAVDSLNGIASGKEDETEREWGELGDPEDTESVAYRISRNADGEETNWKPLMKQAGIRLTVMHKIWGLVEGVETEELEDGSERTVTEAHVKIINPQSVVDWWPKEGMPRQVLVKEEKDLRTSIRDTDNEQDADTFILYELGGWTRFKVEEFKDDSGAVQHKEVILEQGEYEYYQDPKKKMPILPIYPVEIPMPRMVGYLLAKKQNHIFNKKSSRDWGVQILSFALLILAAKGEEFEKLAKMLEKGFNALPQDPDASQRHGFESPDSSYLSEAGDILEEDKKDFFDSAFRQYGDAARQVTATEIRQESRSGVEAFLSLLVASIDEFENNALWRIMQVYKPDQPSTWGSAKVKRSRQFQPEDIQEAMDSMKQRYVGDGPIPLDNQTKAERIAQILEMDGAQVDEGAVERIKEQLDRRIEPEMAQAIAKLASISALSEQTIIETLKPDWDEAKVNKELKRIREESGAVEVPANQMGG